MTKSSNKTEQNVVVEKESEKLMTNQENKQQDKKEFNYFNYVKFLVLKEYYKNKLQGKKAKKLTYTVKFNDQSKNSFFHKNKAFNFVKWEQDINEVGQKVTKVTIKDINLDAKAISKTGKEFNVFTATDKAKAFGCAERELAQ